MCHGLALLLTDVTQTESFPAAEATGFADKTPFGAEEKGLPSVIRSPEGGFVRVARPLRVG